LKRCYDKGIIGRGNVKYISEKIIRLNRRGYHVVFLPKGDTIRFDVVKESDIPRGEGWFEFTPGMLKHDGPSKSLEYDVSKMVESLDGITNMEEIL